MKRIISYILVFIMCLSFAPAVYAKDVAEMSTEVMPEEFYSALLSGDMSPALFISEQETPPEQETLPELDFAKKDGLLTVEVYNHDSADESVLVVGEYSKGDVLVKAHVITDVKDKNPIQISAEYEKIFLWKFPDLTPQCESLSTKCDYEIVEGKEGEWTTSERGHILYSYKGSDTDVVIPNSYMGKRIYAVENQAQISNGNYSIAQINQYSIFNEHQDIKSVKLSEGIQVIGRFAFAGCTSLEKDISIPASAYLVDSFAYYNCSGLTGGLDLSNILGIGSYAFYRCSGLNGGLTLPTRTVDNQVVSPITQIATNAFAECSGLTGELNIPEGVEEIGEFAFACGSPAKNGFTGLKLPSTLLKIGAGAFEYQTKISNELVLPERLEYIGDAAFNHCSGISNTKLNIPASLKTIGGDLNVDANTNYGCHVFYDSFKKVTEFTVAEGNDYFAANDGVLYSKDMTRLVAYPPAKLDTEFKIPEGVTQFDEMSLAYSKITDLTLPDSYVIGDVPANVINDMANNLAVALYHNNSIENVWVNDTNQKYKSADGIVYSKDGKSIWYVPTHKTGTINVAEGTERIEKGAFYIEYETGGETYTGVTIPATVEYIAPECIEQINLRPLEVTIDEGNQHYTVAGGKIVAK